jgi:hypothetical protein
LPGRELPGEFPLTALPSLALAMVVNVSDSVQVSYGMTACMVLGAVSAAAAGRLSVRVSADYEEPLQLFIAAGANPSERKSACMGMVFHSLNEYEIEENARRAPAVRHYKESRELLEEGIARAKKSGDRLKMSDLIDELNSMQEVKDYELLLTDATPEALSRAMSRNGGRMALVSSEGAFLNILAGGYSSGGAANVDVVLKGYSGEPVRVERIGRGSEKITKASLSLCLAVQPDLLETFLSDPTLAGRGMASRFLCCLPQSRVGARTLAGIPAKQEVLDAFGHRLREILSKPEGTELTLSPEAYSVCSAWFQEIEKSLGPGGELAEVGQGWGGKLSGNTLRLAGLMQLLTLQPDTVSEKTMRGAVEIARWFRDHALRLMGGDGELSPEANEVLQWLVRRGEAKIIARLAKNALRRRKSMAKSDTVEIALEELKNAGYIQLASPPRNEAAGRPAGDMLLLHPDLLQKNKRDAEAER